MKNLTIRYKILFPMLIMIVLVVGAFSYLIVEMSNINDQSSLIAKDSLPSISASMEMKIEMSNIRRIQYAYLSSRNPVEAEDYKKRIEQYKINIEEKIKNYQALITLNGEKEVFADLNKAWTEYERISQDFMDLEEKSQFDEAKAVLMDEGKTSFENAISLTDKLVKMNTDHAKEASEYADELYVKDKNMAIAICVFIIIFSIVIIHTIVRSVAVPVKAITDYMNYLAGGKLDKDVPSRDQKDEVGDMARAVQVFKDNMVKARDLESEQEKERKAKETRQQKINEATEKFEHAMTEIVKFVASSSTELQASAQSLAAAAEETSKQSQAVAAASQEASANVQTVSSASEELSASINEIASQVARSSQVAGKAVTDAREAGIKVSELVSAAQKIGEVTQLISGVAEQTNLLALNATIEAARAGEAGKGFAVVAAEVKNLATEATKATEEITSQISSIQMISRTSAESINMICKVIEEMDEISTSISAAIQQQTAATQEISRNVTEAYTGTSEVSENINAVSDAANDTGSASSQVLSAATELSHQATVLKKEFDDFIRAVAAA